MQCESCSNETAFNFSAAEKVLCRDCAQNEEGPETNENGTTTVFAVSKSPHKKARSTTSPLRKGEVESIIATTLHFIAGREIESELGIVSAECVYGMNLFRDAFAQVRDVFGGRSAATQKVLRDAKDSCLHELKNEAYELHADAVLGARLDYTEIGGRAMQGSGMIMLVATGTAVKLKPKEQLT